jgi:hypothetical protein
VKAMESKEGRMLRLLTAAAVAAVFHRRGGGQVWVEGRGTGGTGRVVTRQLRLISSFDVA